MNRRTTPLLVASAACLAILGMAIAWKALFVGIMHGLAGSAALTLLVLTQTRSMSLGLAYLAAFGIGSIGGMALMSGLISVPFCATRGRPGLNRSIRIAAGGLGLVFGRDYAWSQIHPGTFLST